MKISVINDFILHKSSIISWTILSIHYIITGSYYGSLPIYSKKIKKDCTCFLKYSYIDMIIFSVSFVRDNYPQNDATSHQKYNYELCMKFSLSITAYIKNFEHQDA